MAGAGSLYDDLILHISPDKFFVESLTATAAVLVIDRISGEVSLQTNTGQIPVVASRKPLPGGGHNKNLEIDATSALITCLSTTRIWG